MHLMHRVDGHERIGIHLFQVAHEISVFLLIYNGDDLTEGVARVGPDGFHQRCAALQGVENVIQNLGFFLGYDADALLGIDAEDEMIHHDAVEIGAQYAEYGDF